MTGRLHRRSLLPVLVAVLLLAGLAAAPAEAAADDTIRIQVRYPTNEESQWLDRWAAKYRRSPPAAGSGSGSDDDGFFIQPATEEESAYLNRMVVNANKRAAEVSQSQDGGRRADEGFDGHLEFDDDLSFSRLVVDSMYSAGSSKTTKMDDDLENLDKSDVENDVKDL